MKKHNYWNEDRTRQREWDVVLAKTDKGNEYFKEGKYVQAINCYEEAKIMCPAENKKWLSNRLLGAAVAIIDENLKTKQMIVDECIAALDQEDKMKVLERISLIRKHNRQMAKALEDVTWLCLLEGFSNDRPLQNAERITKKIKNSMATLDIVVRFLKEFKHNAVELNKRNEQLVSRQYNAHLKLNGKEDFKLVERMSPAGEYFLQKTYMTRSCTFDAFSNDQSLVNADTFMMEREESRGTSRVATRILKESGQSEFNSSTLSDIMSADRVHSADLSDFVEYYATNEDLEIKEKVKVCRRHRFSHPEQLLRQRAEDLDEDFQERMSSSKTLSDSMSADGLHSLDVGEYVDTSNSDRERTDKVKGQDRFSYPEQLSKQDTEDLGEDLQGNMASPLFVVAIDFGTTYSGWAFSSRNDFLSDSLKVYGYHWNNGGNTMLKTNTCILFDKEGSKTGKYDSCGYEAYDKYVKLCTQNKHQDYYFFSGYKMILYENMEISSQSMLKTVDGKEMRALTVFSETIRFFVKHFNSENAKLYKDVRPNEIQWVLTVPAIWNEKAKTFMREAAIAAGLKSARLKIALEPEAAALYCRALPHQIDNSISSVFQPNTKFMVLDVGGGTYDIIVNKVTLKGLEELHMANGGNNGGTTINKAFWDLLTMVYGKDTIAEFRTYNQDDELRLEQNFEIRKKYIALNDKREDIYFPIPVALHNIFIKGKTMTEIDQQCRKVIYGEKIEVDLKKGNLKISLKILEILFKEPFIQIYKRISELLGKPELSDLTAILMVGGFSDSRLLYEKLKAHLKTDFKNVQILQPTESVSAVMKGAVYFGHDPMIFHKRVCRYTYGIKTKIPFDKKLDSQEMLEVDEDGVEFCKDRFSKHVSAGDQIMVGTFTTGMVYLPFRGYRERVEFPVFVSKDYNPRYTTTKCAYIGKISIDLSNFPKEKDYIEVSMKFGETELTVVRAREVYTGKEVPAKLVFLD